MNNSPTITNKMELTNINPVDHEEVFVIEEDRTYHFDYTDTTTPVNEDTVLAAGVYGPDHPTHAGQPFMPGRWIAQSVY